MDPTFLSPDLLANLFLFGAIACAVILIVALGISARGSTPHPSYRDYERTKVKDRLRTVARSRLQKLRQMSAAELQQLPARQRETKRSFNGRKFFLLTSRAVLADGSVRVTVEAEEPRRFWFSARVAETCVVPGPAPLGRGNVISVLA